jgi:hypothetical protein
VHGDAVGHGVMLDPHGGGRAVGRHGDVEPDIGSVRPVGTHRAHLNGGEAVGCVDHAGSAGVVRAAGDGRGFASGRKLSRRTTKETGVAVVKLVL